MANTRYNVSQRYTGGIIMGIQQQYQEQETQKVGIREFRDNLSRFVEGQSPIALTKHGETVGYYIPTKHKPTQDDLDALITASEKMQALLKEARVTEDELVEDFKALRKAEKK